MLCVLTTEQELAKRKASYEKLAHGNFFDLGGRRFFIAVEKLGKRVEVIELNKEQHQTYCEG